MTDWSSEDFSFPGSRLASSGQPEPMYIPLQHSSVSSTHHLRSAGGHHHGGGGGVNGFSPRNLPLHPHVYNRRPSAPGSPPPSPIRPFPFTATLPRKSPNQLPNGQIMQGRGFLSRQRSDSGLNDETRTGSAESFGGRSSGYRRRMNSAERLTSGDDSPPLPPPPPPPMTNLRHLNYTSRPSMIV